jgi:hypothetical protein
MIEVDLRRWPVIVFAFHGLVSADEFDEYLQALEHILDRGTKHVGVVVGGADHALDASLVRRQAAWIKQHEARMRYQSLGVAFALDSPMMRGVLRAILWLAPLPQPHAVFPSRSQAMTWACARLQEAGVVFPRRAVA